MPPFPKPLFSYEYDVEAQLSALHEHEATKPGRDIPDKAADRLLVATWNIANLGVQDRRDKDYRLLAEIIGWFDVVALQEVNENLIGLRALSSHLSPDYRLLFSDAGGNDERMAFIYDAGKLTVSEEIGEVAAAPSEYRYITLPGIGQRFDGFDRNPYLASFRAGTFTFSLVNVHLYWGSESATAQNRRSLETYAVARWADLRHRSAFASTQDIIPLGDFNLPKAVPGDLIYDALTKRGLHLPEHSTKIASSIASDSNYDQLAFFPGSTQDDFIQAGVFDFDGALFAYLWKMRPADFLPYMRYYISDHRPLWAQFRI
jgi:endonuclease/exonuclease/phosphatase family metal-dependent hydrolase